MQTITRVGYALFFTEENAHEIYLEKARLLSRLRFSLLSYFFSLDFVSPPEFVSASVEYNEATRLSVCIYKGVLFFGFINKVSGLMSFVDKDNTLHAIEPDVFSHLECKMEHAIKSKYNKKEILFERYVTQAWKKDYTALR